MGAPASEFLRTDAYLQPHGADSVQSPPFLSLANTSTTFFSPPFLPIIQASRGPSSEEARAVAVLKEYRNNDIIAWHTLSRSTEPGLTHRDTPGGLSNLEIQAISILRECSYENLNHLLESCMYFIDSLANTMQLTTLIANPKSSPSSVLPTSRIAAAALSRQVRRPSLGSGHTSGHPWVAQLVKATSPYLSNNPYSALKTTQSHLDVRQTLPKVAASSVPGLSKPTNPEHKYWCTVCDDHSFKHSDGWKKHEKEHEFKYVCMLKGLFENTNDGRRCVLCGTTNEVDSHHSMHNVAACVDAANRPSFKRRYDMVGHLKEVHDVQDLATGGIIADKWRCKSSKKVWSCGFCTKISQSLQDHLRNVGTDHFEKGQSIKDWEYSKVIQGLLLQPEIHEAWQHLLESLDPFRPSETKWNKLGSEKLLYKLERGLTDHEDAQSLAKAAYDSAKYDWRPSDEDITTYATTTNTIPKANQNLSEVSSTLSQNRVLRPEEVPVEYHKFSSLPHQVPQIPRSPLKSEAQSAYGTAALNQSPAHFGPPFDQNPEWDPLTSDTGDMSSTQPTTPYNDHRLHSTDPSIYNHWNGYSVTPDTPYNDQDIFHHNNNHKSNWSNQFQTNIDVASTGYALKRRRDSASPSARASSRKNSLKDRSRKKAYRKSSEESAQELQDLGRKYGQRQTNRYEHIREETGENGIVNDGLYD